MKMHVAAAGMISPLVVFSALAQNCTSHWQGYSLNGAANVLYVDSGASSPQLLVGGAFTSPAYIARVSGNSFAAVAPGLNGEVLGITRHNDGSGSTLYATGFVNVAMPGSWTVNYARLEDGSFRSFGGPNGPSTWAGPAISYNVGHGSKFLTSGGFGSPCEYVTQWNGTTWECLGGGLGSVVTDGVVYNDGTGPALFCVGSLIINDLPFEGSIGIGKWNDVAWSAIGGLNGSGTCCVVFDDGSGPELFVGGNFFNVGMNPRVSASNIAKWNGQRWAALGAGTDRYVTAMAAFDDGSGMKLYVAGDFARAGGATAQRLARWDGTMWSACPAGGLPGGIIHSMKTFDPDGAGPMEPALFVAGEFTAVGGGSVSAANFAMLQAAPRSADFNHDGVVDFFDYLDFVAAFAANVPQADFNGDSAIDLFDYLDFVQALSVGC